MASTHRTPRETSDVRQIPRVVVFATLELISWLLQMLDATNVGGQHECEHNQEMHGEANKLQ
jgi:hypothetical protein